MVEMTFFDQNLGRAIGGGGTYQKAKPREDVENPGISKGLTKRNSIGGGGGGRGQNVPR